MNVKLLQALGFLLIGSVLFGCSPKSKEPFYCRGKISYLCPGESGWTYSTALMVDEDLRAWIDEDSDMFSTEGGSVRVKVTRVRSGYVVDFDRNQGLRHFCLSQSAKNKQYGPVVGWQGIASPTGVILPEELRRKTLADLKRGQSGWTQSWALSRDQGILRLRGDFSLSAKRGGNADLKVTRHTNGDYYVDLSWCRDSVEGIGRFANVPSVPVVLVGR